EVDLEQPVAVRSGADAVFEPDRHPDAVAADLLPGGGGAYPQPPDVVFGDDFLLEPVPGLGADALTVLGDVVRRVGRNDFRPAPTINSSCATVRSSATGRSSIRIRAMMTPPSGVTVLPGRQGSEAAGIRSRPGPSFV